MNLKLYIIIDWKESNEKKQQISYWKKFREREVRNKLVDPFMGREFTIRVRFAYYPTIVTDQFTTDSIIENNTDG
ncbi:transcriptional regulator, partial [Streptococcus suis]